MTLALDVRVGGAMLETDSQSLTAMLEVEVCKSEGLGLVHCSIPVSQNTACPKASIQ